MQNASRTLTAIAGALCLGLILAGTSGQGALAQSSWFDRLSNSVDRFVDRLQTPERKRRQARQKSSAGTKGRPNVTGPTNAPPPEAKPGLPGNLPGGNANRQIATQPIPLEPLQRRLQALKTDGQAVVPRQIGPQVALAPSRRQNQSARQAQPLPPGPLMATETYNQAVASEPLAPLSLFTEPVDLSPRASLSTKFTPSAQGGDEIARLLAAQEAQNDAFGLQGSSQQPSQAVANSALGEVILTPRGPRPPPGRTSLIRTARAAVRQAPYAAAPPPMGAESTMFEREGIWAPVPNAKPAPPPGWKAPEVQVAALPAPTRGVCGGDASRWATYTAKEAISQGACGNPRPVLLASVGKVGVKVAPNATVNCSLTSALVRWADKVVAPAARRHLGANVVSVRNMASYACRRRNNAKSGRISEHAYANALDIGEFRLSNGETVSVLDHWRRGGGKQAFLREVHKKSCGIFKTVLGPNADRHHQNHFHFDLAKRKSTYCR